MPTATAPTIPPAMLASIKEAQRAALEAQSVAMAAYQVAHERIERWAQLERAAGLRPAV